VNEPRTQADALLSRARRLLSDHRTRAKRDGAELDYSLHDLRQLLATSPTCTYCRAPVAFDAQLDHRTPIARGGRHALDNLVVCCARCNQLKGQLTEAEFDELLGLLALLHPAARADLERRLLSGGRRYARRGDRPSTLQ
jgi:5-methylcytosine-specific restriction endonuclease McrA